MLETGSWWCGVCRGRGEWLAGETLQPGKGRKMYSRDKVVQSSR